MNHAPPTPALFGTGAPESFDAAAAHILDALAAVAPMACWCIAEVQVNEWVPLAVRDRHYGLRDGEILHWTDTVAHRIAQADGLAVLPDTADAPELAAAPALARLPMRSYAGVAIAGPGGRLFGTLSGFDPQPQPLQRAVLEPLLRMGAAMLSCFLCGQAAREQHQRALAQAETESRLDAMTGLLNRRGWDEALAREQARLAQRSGGSGLICIDLDGLKPVNDTQGHAAGDELIRRAGRVLKLQVREADSVARVGGDEFAILVQGAYPASLQSVALRVGAALNLARVQASIGWEWSGVGGSLEQAWERADAAMYARKQARKRSATHAPS